MNLANSQITLRITMQLVQIIILQLQNIYLNIGQAYDMVQVHFPLK